VFHIGPALQPSYRQFLDFALKLGYSERLVQLALGRLGNPTNNELLAELIKLGAQPGSNGNGGIE
jgi:ribonuclease ZC3H12